MKQTLTFGQKIAREQRLLKLLRAVLLGAAAAVLLWELTP